MDYYSCEKRHVHAVFHIKYMIQRYVEEMGKYKQMNDLVIPPQNRALSSDDF